MSSSSQGYQCPVPETMPKVFEPHRALDCVSSIRSHATDTGSRIPAATCGYRITLRPCIGRSGLAFSGPALTSRRLEGATTQTP